MALLRPFYRSVQEDGKTGVTFALSSAVGALFACRLLKRTLLCELQGSANALVRPQISTYTDLATPARGASFRFSRDANHPTASTKIIGQ